MHEKFLKGKSEFLFQDFGVFAYAVGVGCARFWLELGDLFLVKVDFEVEIVVVYVITHFVCGKWG